jgi:hypothetical protein
VSLGIYVGITGERITYSTIPLALALGADVFVVGIKIVSSDLAEALAGIAVLALVGFWHDPPLLARWRQEHRLNPSKWST